MTQFKFSQQTKPSTWLITGVAGFIGSRLLETLLKVNQNVIGLDNFSTGHRYNLEDVMRRVRPDQWLNFKLIKGDICSLDDCNRAVEKVDYVLHHAAFSSVPRSIDAPLFTNANNVSGFLNILEASRHSRVKRIVYATSSAIYGNQAADSNAKHESGRVQSPYAMSKLVNELYADVFFRVYGVESIGLRYFNVYGPRQDPEGAYAAVIPTWVNAMIKDKPVIIYGDGNTSRDFCYIDDIVSANMLAAKTTNAAAVNQIYDVGVGNSLTLNALFHSLKQSLLARYPQLDDLKPIYQDFRSGDVRYSQANITKTQNFLDYKPRYSINKGLQNTIEWYIDVLDNSSCTNFFHNQAEVIT
jgi:UDP-N-acetylglucosamine 4-epimerase